MTPNQVWKYGLRAFAYVAVLAVLMLGWQIQRENAKLTRANDVLRSAQAEVLAGANHPVLIRGFCIPLLEHLDLVEDHRVSKAPSTRQLVLVYKASCDSCKRQIPIWENILRDARLTNVETWLVSVGDDGGEAKPLIAALRDRNLDYKLLRTRSAAAFAIATGIGTVPDTIVTAGQDTVEFVAPGFGDKTRLDLILDAIGEAPRPSAHIFPISGAEPLN
jgi:hypothetical protein